MKYSQATNYALHTVVYMIKNSDKQIMRVQELADSQNISTTYLSKILSRLVKEGIIVSVSGVKGGYRLSKDINSISFLDVIKVIEGNSSLFECNPFHGEECSIYKIMLNAEKKMEKELENIKLIDLAGKETGNFN